jgi:hypothetical protein
MLKYAHIMSPQEKFLFELNIFRNEITLVTRSLYMELAIHAIASKNKSILNAMNRTPTFWNAVLSGFQSSTFITLGRIFDLKPNNHSIHTLFRLANDNRFIFSRVVFEERWKNGDGGKSPSLINYLPEYMEKFYEPTDADFLKLRKLIGAQQKIYESIYSPIRHNFGHKIYSTNEEVKVIFEKVNIRGINGVRSNTFLKYVL